MIRTLVVVLACTIPAIAFASADDKSTTTSVLHCVNTALLTWVATGMGPVRARLTKLEAVVFKR
jgi:predicted membrane protein